MVEDIEHFESFLINDTLVNILIPVVKMGLPAPSFYLVDSNVRDLRCLHILTQEQVVRFMLGWLPILGLI